MKLVFASQNENKKREFEQLLLPRIQLITLHELRFFEELPEPFETLEENAKSKAAFVFEEFQLPCLSEDSGLEIDALNGEPGVHSSRYAGPGKKSNDNIDLVLEKMTNETNRNAQFRTVICLMLNEEINFFEGSVKGTIAKNTTGISGFGYDPIFIPEGLDKTFAEIPAEEKNKRSHRAAAIKKLNEFLMTNSLV